MKKLMCVMILLAFVGSTLIMTGCGGGGGGIGAILAGAVIILAISASGGSGAAVFAANEKYSIRPAIAIVAPKIVITPLKADGTIDAAAEKIEVPSASITKDNSSGNSVYKVNQNLGTLTGYNQYLVELFDGDVLLVKAIKYVYEEQKTGTELVTTLNSTTTAKALAFDAWKGAHSGLYSDFEYLSKNTDFSALVTAIDSELNDHVSGQNNVNYADSSVTNQVTAINVSTTVPNEVILVNETKNVYRGHEIFFEREDQIMGPAVSTLIGLSYFNYQTIVNQQPVNSYRLGNFFHFHNTDEEPITSGGDSTTVIAYAGNGNLDQFNSTPTTWYTNSYQAKTAAGQASGELSANDVFYFRVQKEGGVFMYGAIKVTIIGENLSFHYKYNRNYGSTNITIQ